VKSVAGMARLARYGYAMKILLMFARLEARVVRRDCQKEKKCAKR
jgi:hypothetical protein